MRQISQGAAQAVAILLLSAGGALAQMSEGGIEPPPDPELLAIQPTAAALAPEPAEPGPAAAPAAATDEATPRSATLRDPSRGAVTNLPLPRFVSLKTSEGNARRGPGLGHRVDWVFARAGMPLRVTAEHENWRRVEDAEGAGGWVHYTLLSGVRSVLVTEDMVEFRASPRADATVVLQAEAGVVARLLECEADWCRLSADGKRGWVAKASIWGVEPGETLR